MNDMLSTQEMKKLQFKVQQSRTAVCPTCGISSTFTFSGTQQWPPHIAEKAGLPEVMNVWSCDSCGTTLLEPNLTFDE